MHRKSLFLALIFAASVLTVNCQTKAGGKIEECKYLSFAQAEKILGTRVELITHSWTFTSEATKFDCTYRAARNDQSSGKEINLFFRLEESTTEAQAKRIYETILESNKNHAGIETLSGIGDEAYTHSDQPNFLFILARKGKFTVRLKINKAVFYS